jgi:hypothetical protein
MLVSVRNDSNGAFREGERTMAKAAVKPRKAPAKAAPKTMAKKTTARKPAARKPVARRKKAA